MKQRTGTCTKELFWEAVAEIGWGTKTTNYKVVEKAILKNWDNEFISSFDDLLGEFKSPLYVAVENFEERNGVSCGCGDDGFSDLLNHVVGLGQEAYEAAMKDPMLVVKRGQKYDFTESFSYCVPHVPARLSEELTFEQAIERAREVHGTRGYGDDEEDEDFELYLKAEALELMLGPKAKFDARRYAFWAQRDLPDLELLKESPFAGEFPELDEVLGALKKVADGDVTPLLEEGFKAKVRKLREDREKLYRRKMEELYVLNSRGWSIDNLVGDARQYLLEEEDSTA